MLKLQKAAQAGSLESSDIQITIAPAPAGAGIQIELASATLQQFGQHIKDLITRILNAEGITEAVVQANDKGAVDCIIEARLKTALIRASAE